MSNRIEKYRASTIAVPTSWLVPVVIFFLLFASCAHRSSPAPSTAFSYRPSALAVSTVDEAPRVLPATASEIGNRLPDDSYVPDDLDEEIREEPIAVADPFEPFNRAMFHFNDRLYFWVLKPVAQTYSNIVPEVARVSVNYFFLNLLFPVRFVNCLLQVDLGGAATELGRFVINTTSGIGGYFDPASSEFIDLKRKQDKDLGLTLGYYGVGHGVYLNWPLLGPSSPRDTFGMVGDFFLNPLTYLNPSYVAMGVRGFDKVNSASLKIGDYESLKEAAIDPYVAIRDAYIQQRTQTIKRRTEKGKFNATMKE